MGDQHLSELCRGSELEPIQLRLKQIAGDQTTDANEESDAATAYISGIWGYRDEDGRTAFHWAIALKNYDLARRLMGAPCNSPVLTEDNDSVTPFETACTVGAPEELVSELLEKSVAAYDVFMQCPSLHNKTSRDPQQITPSVLEPNPAEGPGESAHATAADATASAPPTESEAGAGATTKSDAAAPPHPEQLTDLVLNHEDELGNTPLIHAVSRGHRRIVNLLIQKGADLNHQNARGQTALHRAVSRGGQDLVEELVRASEKANGTAKVAHRRWMNLQDYRGDSALFYASMENNEDVGRYLLHHGADRELRNKEGKQFWEV